MSKKQKTLFDTWNITSTPKDRSDSNTFETFRNTSNAVNRLPNINIESPNQSTSNAFQSPKYSKTNDLANPEFDYEAGKTWIYPTNYPVRDYQFSIVQEALFKNTLVVLPTGLGKTFIAAVVMYNIYRWYPNGKVVFMAPTKPLVAQQVDACFNVTGISQEDTTQMTGTNSPELRKRLWLIKRVFFLTPQVLVNDLVRNICPASSIKCLVVDEAHKALGNHAYCQVIKELCNYTTHFRVLALTATPGSETQAVRQVLSNLLISHVEMRSEDSGDVQQYTHIRAIEKIVVPLGDTLTSLKSRFLDIINIYLKRLTLRKAMTAKNPSSLSKYQILKLREMFSQHPPSNIGRSQYGLAMADFSLCISLYHAYELLLLHGATSFYNFLSGILNGDKSIPHSRFELSKNFEFEEIMKNVKEIYIPDPIIQNAEVEKSPNKQKKKVLPSHPKLDKLLEVVLQHFRIAERDAITDTRVMIFTQYRDSVQEIVNMFNHYQPMVKVMSFVGQSSKSATGVGVSQKQQLKVIQQFRSGGYNTLVSTCVGEEGLDIGEVDLIVCYDCPKSPIRLVQRMGRTGRLRKGRIIILLAEGKEEQMYNTCEYRKKSVYRSITQGFSFAQFYQNSPSLIPSGIIPVCDMTEVTIKPKAIDPQTKVVSKSPYLTEDEMIEYDKHVKISKNPAPLLPKREFIILKHSSKENTEDESNKVSPPSPQLSLSEWTLWQTTLQRTHMIPHSSKSTLLVKTLELIHFPELLTSRNVSFDLSNIQDSPQKIGNPVKSQYQLPESFRQSKITDLLSTSTAMEDFEGDVITILSSPEKDIYKVNSPVLKPSDTGRGLPLIQQLFNICLLKSFDETPDCHLKLLPSSTRLPSIEDFSSVDVKNPDSVTGLSILRVLNKKMKAKIKRKSRELSKNISFCSDTPTKNSHTKSITPTKSLHTESITPKKSLHTKSITPTKSLNTKSITPTKSLNTKPITPTKSLNTKSITPTKNLHAKSITPSKNVSNSANLKENENNCLSFDIALDNSNLDTCLTSENANAILDQDVLKAVSFDIDFDIPDVVANETPTKPNAETVTSIPSDVLSEKRNTLQSTEQLFDVHKFEHSCILESELTDLKHSDSFFSDDSKKCSESDTRGENNDIEIISTDFTLSEKSGNLETFEPHSAAKPVTISTECHKEKDYFSKNAKSNVPKSNGEIVPNIETNSKPGNFANLENVSFNASEKYNNFSFKKIKMSALKEHNTKFPISEESKLDASNIKAKSVASQSKILPAAHHEDTCTDKYDHILNFDVSFGNADADAFKNVAETARLPDHDNTKFHMSEESKLNASNIKAKSPASQSKLLSAAHHEDKCTDKYDNILNFGNTDADAFKNVAEKARLPDHDSNFNISSATHKNSQLSLSKNVNSPCSLNLFNKNFSIEKYENTVQVKHNDSLLLPGEASKTFSDSKHCTMKRTTANEYNINFDVSFSFDDHQNEPKPNPSLSMSNISKVPKVDPVPNVIDNINEFEEDASSILEQLFTSQKNLSEDLDSSFSSPLTVKKCISENKGRRNGSSKNEKKHVKIEEIAPKSPNIHTMNESVRSSELFKIPSKTKNVSFTKGNLCSNSILNKSSNIAETSQYSLTQLLSLIDNTASGEKHNSTNTQNMVSKEIQNCSEVIDDSSEDEVCPTPPKEIVKTKSKFIYSNKSTVRKSLANKYFGETQKNSQLYKNDTNAQHDLCISTSASEFPTMHNAKESSYKLQAKTDTKNKANNCISALKASGCSNEMHSSIDKEINHKSKPCENNESDPYQKITFDVSFEIPFTEEDDLENQFFDLNKAITEEDFPSLDKLHDSQDFTESFLECRKDQVTDNIEGKNAVKDSRRDIDANICSENKYLLDELEYEDSESLLPSKPVEDVKFVAGATSLEIASPKFNISVPKSLNLQDPDIARKITGNCFPEEKPISPTFSNELDHNDFEKSIFFKLLPTPNYSISTKNNASSISNNALNSNVKTERKMYDLHFKEQSACNYKKDNQEVEQNGSKFNPLASNLMSVRPSISKSKIVSDMQFEDPQPCKYKSIDSKNISEVACSADVQNTVKIIKSNSSPKNEVPINFSEEKLEFDLCYDNDETCDLLPAKISANASINPFKAVGKCDDLSKKTHSLKNISENVNFGDFVSLIPSTSVKRTKDLETLSENYNFKSKDTRVSDKKYCSENIPSITAEEDEIINKFYLSDEDQSFFLEIENIDHKPGPVTSSKIVNNNISLRDECIDLNPNQNIMVQMKQNQQFKIPAVKNPLKNTDIYNKQGSSTSKFDLNVKDQGSSSNKIDKLSSKLSVKNKSKTVTKHVMKNNSFVEEDDDDFQFLRKIQKRVEEPSAGVVEEPSAGVKKKRKKVSNRNEFFLSQAEVSGSDDSEHESPYDEEDALEDSFINDESSQKLEYTDQHAFYLRSLKNCAGMPQQFKLKALERNNISYLPEPPGECSNYLYDSFCVNDEEVVFTSSGEDVEYDSRSKSKKGKRDKRANKKLKRVITLDSSSSSEYEIPPKVRKRDKEVDCAESVPLASHNDSIIPAKKRKAKFLVSSDEDDENISLKSITVKPHEKEPEKVLKNSSYIKSAIPAVSSTSTQKCEFSLNFDDNNLDFDLVSNNKKAKKNISMKLVDSPNEKSVSSERNVSNPSINLPSTSKPVYYDADLKSSEYACADTANMTFDIGWDEVVSTSKRTEVTPEIVPDADCFSSKPLNDVLSTILVDSRELASGKPVISALRNIHKVNPIVMQLISADYIISNRVAVERILDSEFSSCSMPPKIIERIKAMDDLYEKSVVIIEKDNRKNALSYNKNATKYLQFAVHLNHHPSIKVLYSKSSENTSQLIFNLIEKENKRGYHINVPVTLNSKNRNLYEFYLSFPKVTPLSALNFMYNFPTIESFSQSSVEELKAKGCISSHKAVSIFKYFRSELTFHDSINLA